MNELEAYRKEIDQIDKVLIETIAKRMEVVKKVGIYKKQNNIPPLDSKRWEQVLKSKCKLAKDYGLTEKDIVNIYNTIHKMALDIEKIE